LRTTAFARSPHAGVAAESNIIYSVSISAALVDLNGNKMAPSVKVHVSLSDLARRTSR